jgi:hypothetical protein
MVDMFYTCENGTLKPIEVILRRGAGEEGEQWQG